MAPEMDWSPPPALDLQDVFSTGRNLAEIRTRISRARAHMDELRANPLSRFFHFARIRNLRAHLRRLGSAEVIASEFAAAAWAVSAVGPAEWHRLDEKAKQDIAAAPLNAWLANRRAHDVGKHPPRS